MRKLFITLLFSLLCVTLSAQSGTVQIEGEYIYRASAEISLAEAKAEALKRAKIEALADSFGTIVSQNAMNVSTSNRGDAFYAEGETLVKGEWVKTIGQPEYECGFFEDGIWVKCRVKGYARRISMDQVELDIHVFANGIEPEYETSTVKSGSHVYMSVKSPVKGYLSVFLYDPVNDVVACLFPYKGSEHTPFYVPANKNEILFNKEHDATGMHVRQITVSCEKDVEINNFYVVFSTNDYSLPLMEDHAGNATVPESLTFEQFNKWKAKKMSVDSKFHIFQKSVSIVK